MTQSTRSSSPAAAQRAESVAAMHRLHDIMLRESSTRMTIATLALAASALLIQPWVALLSLAVDHLADRIVLATLVRIKRKAQTRDIWLFLFAIFAGNAAFITPAVVLMATGKPFYAVLALFFTMGALLHITNVLAVHRTAACIALVAILVPLAASSAAYLLSIPDYTMLAFAALAFLLTSLYTLSVIQSNHLLHADLAAANDASEAATEARERLLAVMSHEMRTPLNAVSGITDEMRAQPHLPPAPDHLEILSSAANDMRGLVDDLVDLAAINAGALRITTEPGSPMGEIRQVVATHRPLAEEKGLELRTTFSPGIPKTAHISPLRLRQCLGNLVVNAIKYTETGYVHVHVSYGKREALTITVEDTGPGIPRDARTRIFDSFARLDRAQTDKTLGVGLGLPIARELARRMGGDLTVGEGSTGGARFRLRVSTPPADGLRQWPKPRAAALPPGLKALVVDDLSTNRIVAQLYLSRLGLDIAEASDCAEALSALASGHFDLVLLDLRMPGIDGAGTLARIRGAGAPWSDLPIIAMTADAGEADRRRALASGFNGYVAKPVDAQSLSDAISDAIQLDRAGKALARTDALRTDTARPEDGRTDPPSQARKAG